jgi:hypothetical protein
MEYLRQISTAPGRLQPLQESLAKVMLRALRATPQTKDPIR